MHRLRRRRLAPGDAEADLEHAGRLDVAGLDHALGEQQMAGLEHFGRDHAGVADRDRHGFQIARRVHEDVAAHVHAAHVEAADVRLELDDVLDALAGSFMLVAGQPSRRIVGAGREARRGCSQVDEHVAPAGADALDHLAIQRLVHAGPGSLGIAHMDVHDGGPGLGGVDCRLGNLLRRHRNGRVPAGVSADPVTAHEIMTLRCIRNPRRLSPADTWDQREARPARILGVMGTSYFLAALQIRRCMSSRRRHLTAGELVDQLGQMLAEPSSSSSRDRPNCDVSV
jgi:hypothetical protein